MAQQSPCARSFPPNPAQALAAVPGLSHLWKAAQAFSVSSPGLSRHYIACFVDAAAAAGVEVPSAVGQLFCPSCCSLFAAPANVKVRTVTRRRRGRHSKQRLSQKHPETETGTRLSTSSTRPAEDGCHETVVGPGKAKHSLRLKCTVCRHTVRVGVGAGPSRQTPTPSLQLPATPLRAVASAQATPASLAAPADKPSPAACSNSSTPARQTPLSGERKRKKKKKRDTLAAMAQRNMAGGGRKKPKELSLTDFLSSI